MADNNFEQQLHKQMEQFKLRPSNTVWQNVDAQLRKDKRRRWFFFLLSTAALLGIVGCIVYTSQQQITSQPVTSAPVQAASKTGENSTTPSLVPAPTTNKSEEKKSALVEPIPTQPVKSTTLLTHKILKHKTSVSTIKNQPLSVLQIANTKKTNKASIQESRVDTVSNNAMIAFNPSPKDKDAASVVKKDTSAEPDHLPQSPVSIPAVVDSKNSTSVSVTTEKASIQNEKNKETKDSSSTKSVSSGAQKEKHKWQKGIQFHLGLADIVESILPGSEYKRAESIPFFTQGSSSAAPNNISGITVSEYNVVSSVNMGAAYLLRKKIFKQSLFVTGIQYQYNRFTVNQRISRDTFSVALNRLINDFSSKEQTSFSFHYISIPMELQWHLTKTTNGKIMLGTGLVHSFRLSSTAALPAFINNSSGPSFYQPLLQLTPSYEWSTNKSVMQLGWYFNYGLLPVYNNTSKNHWWQTGLRLQYYFKATK